MVRYDQSRRSSGIILTASIPPFTRVKFSTMFWIDPAFSSLQNCEKLVSLTREKKQLNSEIIELWKRADQSRHDPGELIKLFGEGFAKFTLLPESLKKLASTYVYNALCEAVSIANDNKIRVRFDFGGAKNANQTVTIKRYTSGTFTVFLFVFD